MFSSDRGIFKRAPRSPINGTLTLDDDSERTLVDVGELDGAAVYRIQTAILNITLGSHSSMTVRVKADVGGTLATVDEHTYNSAQVGGVFEDLNPDNITANRVALTAQATAIDPSTPGEVDRSVSFTRAY